MKINDKPQISKSWWTGEKPNDVKGADLEKALANAEKSLNKVDGKADSKSIEDGIASLADLEKAVDKTIKKELDKKSHKTEISVLDKFYALIKAETKRLTEALADLDEGEADEDEEGKLFQKDYLHKMMALMKSTDKQLNFALGLNPKSPGDCVLLLARKGKPEKLFRMLKGTGEFSKIQMTCGVAKPDPNNSKVLELHLGEGESEPPQALKTGRVFLRSDKGLKFRKLKFVSADGKVSEDTEPDDDELTPEQSQDNLSAELAAVDKMSEAWEKTLNVVSVQIEKLRNAIANQGDSILEGISDALGGVVGRFPDLDLSQLREAAKANNRAAYDQTLAHTADEVKQVYRMLAEDPVLATIDENPFIKTNVHGTIKTVLEKVTKKLTTRG